MERKFFKKIPSEKITIMIKGRGESIVYLKSKEKDYFDDYKEDLSAYAKKYRLTFFDNTK